MTIKKNNSQKNNAHINKCYIGILLLIFIFGAFFSLCCRSTVVPFTEDSEPDWRLILDGLSNFLGGVAASAFTLLLVNCFFERKKLLYIEALQLQFVIRNLIILVRAHK